MGRRLGELTKENTKCMVPVNGVRLIDRLLTQLSQLNLSRVLIVVGYQGQRLIDHIGDRYADRLNILLGYEHDWLSPANVAEYDYYIESVHYVNRGGTLYCVDNTRQILTDAARTLYGGDMYALCRDYFETVCRSIEGTGAQILGHIELVMKFNENRDLFDDANPRYLAPALQCAELAARSERLIEINTGAISRGYRTQPYPGVAMLRRIAECGGRIILTSDCHNSDYLDCAFGEATQLARACGFSTAWEYRGAEAVEYKL